MSSPETPQAGQTVYRNPLLGQIPFITKSVIITLVTLYLLGLVPDIYKALALVPANTTRFFIWNLVTAGFLESSFLSTVMNCIIMLSLGRTIEPLWGSQEMFRFILIIDVVSSSFTFILMFFLYVVTRTDLFLFIPICGFSGIIAALLVSFRQSFPEQEIPMLGRVSLRAKNLALIYICFELFFSILRGKLWTLPFTLFGFYFGWLYLRLFQRHTDGSRGDATPGFSFAAFFPEAMRPTMGAISTGCGLCCNKITMGKFPMSGNAPSDHDDDLESGIGIGGQKLGASGLGLGPTIAGVPSSPTASTPFSNVSVQESERRRAKALRALDLRLGKEAEKERSKSLVNQGKGEGDGGGEHSGK